MMLDELIVEQEFRRVNECDHGRLALEAEARAAASGGLRTRIASALVYAGARLDRGAIERARPVVRTRVAGPTSRW